MPCRARYTGLFEKYRNRLPVDDDTRIIIRLGESNAPLIRLCNAVKRAILDNTE